MPCAEVRRTVNRVEAVALIVADLAVKLSARERADALLNAWSVREPDAGFVDLPEELRTRMVERDEPDDPDERLYDPLVALALRWQFRGVLNSYLEERLAAVGITATVEGPVEPTVACPCCGFFSLEARNALEICRVCLWEDTGDDPELHSGPNHMTLREGRANFVQHGVCEPRLRAATELDLSRRYRR